MSRPFAIGSSRDERIAGNPSGAHIARHSAKPLHAFTCVHAGCTAMVDDCGLYCALHLWTLDNPVLRDAPIFGRVVVL
jgi:hypothetical protein